MRLLKILFILFCCLKLEAQTPNIVKLEYFVDNDPGFDHGTSVAFISDTDVTIAFNANINATPAGLHWLYLRAKDAHGNWTNTNYRPVFTAGITNATASAITYIEYFIDNDPGYGHGTSISFTPSGTDTQTVSTLLSLTGLSTGFHFIYLRAKTQNGDWSIVSYRAIYVDGISNANTANIVQLEAYIDADPGYGLGQQLAIPLAPDTTFAGVINLTGISTGMHKIFIRAKDQYGKWSITNYRIIYVDGISNTNTANIVQLEAFVDNDPGYGLGQQLPIVAAPDTSFKGIINLTGISAGMHVVYARAKDQYGKWSITFYRLIYVDGISNGDSAKIVQLEAYVDTDPGFGHGQQLPIVNAADTSFKGFINLSGIVTGMHPVFVRAKDQYGKWSIINYKMIYVDGISNGDTAKIVQLEAYVDTDPGFGLGQQLPIVNAPDTSFVGIMSLNGVSTGLHFVYVRAKDQYGKWSIINYKAIFVDGITANDTIVSVEYFWDADPGVGLATQVAVNPGTDITKQFALNMSAINPGIHMLGMRAKDNHGKYGVPFKKLILKEANGEADTMPHVVKLEYFIVDSNDVVVQAPRYYSNFSPDTDVTIHFNPFICVDTVKGYFLLINGIDERTGYGIHYTWPFFVDTASHRPYVLHTIPNQNYPYNFSPITIAGLDTVITDANLPNDHLNFTVTSSEGKLNLSVNPNTHLLTATHINGASGYDTVTVTVVDTCGNFMSTTFIVHIVAPINCTNFTIAHVNVSNNRCFSDSTGEIIVTATSGVLPYQYKLNAGSFQVSDTFLFLPAGNYTVFIKDSVGCTYTDTAIAHIVPPLRLVDSVITTPVSTIGGHDGAAAVHIGGGTLPYGCYQWNNAATMQTINGISAGIYCVTVCDGNFCTASACGTVTQPTCPGFAVSSIIDTNVTCYGAANGIIKVIPTGGTPPYQYALNNSSYQSSAIFSNLPPGNYAVHVKDTVGCIYTDSSAILLSQPQPLVVSVTTTPATMVGGNDGTAAGHVRGGTIPYNCYLWSTGGIGDTITNLPAGIYCLTVCDINGCTAGGCDTVSQPSCSGFAISQISDTMITCFGAANGVIDIQVNGGVSPYHYTLNSFPFQLSSRFTGLHAANYVIYVTDSVGCSLFDSAGVNITQPAPLIVAGHTTAVSTVGGNNGTSTALVSGGTSPYTYVWQPGADTSTDITGLTAGIYCVTVSDMHSCTVTICDTVSQPNCTGFLVDSVKTNNVKCYGESTGSIIVYATGGISPVIYSVDSPASFQVSDTFNHLPAATYFVKAKDSAGCITSYAQSAVVTQPGPISASVTVYGDTMRTGLFISYQWYLNNVAITGATSQIHIAARTGNYYVVVTDSNGCIANSDTVNVLVTALELIRSDELSLSVFPNPFSTEVNIHLQGILRTGIAIDLYDLSGRKVSEGYFSLNSFVLSTSGLSAGAYLLSLHVNGTVFYRKLIRQ